MALKGAVPRSGAGGLPSSHKSLLALIDAQIPGGRKSGQKKRRLTDAKAVKTETSGVAPPLDEKAFSAHEELLGRNPQDVVSFAGRRKSCRQALPLLTQREIEVYLD